MYIQKMEVMKKHINLIMNQSNITKLFHVYFILKLLVYTARKVILFMLNMNSK